MVRPKGLERVWRRGMLVDAGLRQVAAGACGPCAATRRDLDRPQGWVGLSWRDHRLLERFVELLRVRPVELHTNVRVGRVPVLEAGCDTECNRRIVSALWPRRVDAAMRFGNGWWLVECKPDANHYVLGQLLCYAFWWSRDVPGCELDNVVLVTDACDPDVLPVLCECGIEVLELGSE